MVQCSGVLCSYVQCTSDNLNCGSDFTVMSLIWEIGRAIALIDQIYFKSGDKNLEVCQLIKWTEKGKNFIVAPSRTDLTVLFENITVFDG